MPPTPTVAAALIDVCGTSWSTRSQFSLPLPNQFSSLLPVVMHTYKTRQQSDKLRATTGLRNTTTYYTYVINDWSTTGDGIPSSACTRRPDEIGADGFSSSNLAGTNSGEEAAAAASGGGGAAFEKRGEGAAAKIRFRV
ncbi:nitrate reductase [Dorcoceras hygrometricum]|uniref:Nitrate reductase n=1 Tax=Dorcoceras hygrometricum TaxID=472368 RepID=A0A2Z7BA88_9LAMI|nr:nitrate reductase [Dorcoceras hygrometricum]